MMVTTNDIDSLTRDFAARVRSATNLSVVHKPFGATPLVGQVMVPPPPTERQPIARSAVRRVEDMLADALQVAIKKCGFTPRPYHVKQFEAALERHSSAIINAAKLTPTADRLEAEAKERRATARKSLADELKAGRRRLRELRWTVTNAEKAADKAVELRAKNIRREWAAKLVKARQSLRALQSAHEGLSAKLAAQQPTTDGYAPIPAATHDPHRDGRGLPSAPGIYFLWNGDVIEYVGQATKLCNRVKLGSHHVLRADHRISYVFVDAKELTWTECYYIGIVRPKLNFGRMASHYEGDE